MPQALFSNTHQSGLQFAILPAVPSPDPLDATAFSHLDSPPPTPTPMWESGSFGALSLVPSSMASDMGQETLNLLNGG